MNISTNYSQNFSLAKLNLNSAKNMQNQQQQQVNKNQNSNIMYIGKQGVQSKQDNRIEELTKRKEELQNRINEIQAGQRLQSNDNISDPQAVKEKIEELQESIKEIENSINTIKQEKKEEKEAKNSSKNAEKTDEENIIASSKSLDRIKQAHCQQVSMEGQANILKSEIKMDKMRKVDTSLKQKELSNINSGIEKLNNTISKEMKKVNNKNNSKDSNSVSNSNEEMDYSEKLIQKYSENTNMFKQENNIPIINTCL